MPKKITDANFPLRNPIDEEKIVSQAYDMAEKMYKRYGSRLRSVSIDRDDYIQDAVIYVLNLFRKDYMNIANIDNAKGIIYKMLGRFTLNQIQIDARKVNRRGEPLDTDINMKDDLESSTKSPEEEYLLEEGRLMLEDIIEQLDVTPFKSIKHSYKGFEKTLGEISLSEQNIAKLLYMGNHFHDILKIYNVETNNTGSSSEATFVHRKIKQTLNKLADIINSLNYDDEKLIKDYIEKI
jgi:DNA-directed RNA polymerase specialized sigma24 family protein